MVGSFTLFEVRGVPIKLHVTTLLMLPMLQDIFGSLTVTLLYICILLGSVALHELGHTIVAQRHRIPVRDIILTPIGGVARTLGMPDNPHHETRIALAGPAVSLLFAVACRSMASLMRMLLLPVPYVILRVSANLNLMLLLFNLIPSFPMDGGRVLRAALVPRLGLVEATRIAAEIGKYVSIAFIAWGLLRGHWNLILIGAFILMAANAEYQMVRLKAWQDPYVALDGGFEVGPPPYARDFRRGGGFWGDVVATFEELFEEVCRVCFRR